MDESPKRGLLASYGRLLGPLIRILIRNGVSFDEFSSIAKQTYVEVASKEFRVKESTPSLVRLTALTGINEAEISQLKASLNPTSEEENTLDGIVRVLAAWHTDTSYTGPYGIPVELKFEDRSQLSFSHLAKQYFSNIEPQKLLNELIKNGLVIETERDWYKVLARNYRPKGTAPDGLEHLARTFTDMVNTLDHNLLETDGNKRLFERQVYTEDGIKEEDLPRFQAFAKTRASVLLDELDNWLTQLEKPEKKKHQTLTTGVGIFNYVQRIKDQ
jgi:hypothetical protein